MMDTDILGFRPDRRSPHREDLRPVSHHSLYLSPPPLYLNPTKLSLFPTREAYSPLTHHRPRGSEGMHYTQREGSQKRKRRPQKMEGSESPTGDMEEVERRGNTKTVDLNHLPFSLPPRPCLPPSPMPIQGMIDLSRLQLHHRAMSRYETTMGLPLQVKQEPLSPSPLWPPSPLLHHHPPPLFFPPLHPSLLPFPFFMPGPIMHLSPGAFYPGEAPRPSRRSPDRGPRGGMTSAEKLGLNIHIDDSYHVDVGGNQKRWKCRTCEKSYTSKYNLVTHILGHSGIKPHSCHLCGNRFKQLSHLHTHLLTHQGTRPHKCQVCHKAFTQTSHLKRHMMQHSDVKPYSCGVCGRGFAYPSELRAHELKHEKGQENVCVECGLDFPTLAQLKRHLMAHRGPTLYRCSECQKSFQYPSQLQNHMMKHKDIRPYICSECGMEFIQSHHLKQHTLTHKYYMVKPGQRAALLKNLEPSKQTNETLERDGVKEHKCRICGREFTLLANMKRHVLIHTNIRSYQCHLCFKSFVQKQTLKAHMIVHSDIKPYKCKLCGKEFNRMHNLMGHMHLHSDSRPFKCRYCPSKFTLKGNLTRHMKVKHGIMDMGLNARVFRRRGRFCLSAPLGLRARSRQEEPFDLSQKPRPPRPSLRLSQSDGESVPGSSCQEEDEEDSLYRRSQYSPEVYQHHTGGQGYRSETDRQVYGQDMETVGQGYRSETDRQVYGQDMKTRGQVYPPRAGEEVYQPVSEPGDAEEKVYQHVTGRQVYDSDSELGGQLYEQEAGGHHIGANVRYPGSGNTGKHVYHSESELDDQLYKPDPDQLEIGDQVYHSDAGEEMMDTPEPCERDYHSDPGVYYQKA
ncbi:zinc finger protein 366 [Oncorhynchus tshawytscha]|uniref:Zinc finger protein 710 n=1 Tax=Oncorhynchus tshawytscha TaxID=74940 RepID=A0A8C8FSQ6_ONCTS|nr:zinc finger protein 366 [Oncorhynchus tshawytscha]